MAEPIFLMEVPISFGHCDPAGIVFYPNYFRWFDRCFHTFLQERAGGHRHICAELGAVGLGLMDVGARFTAPAREGDLLVLEMAIREWASRSLTPVYAGRVEGRVVVEGHETRGMFVLREGRMRAGEMGPLRAMLEPQS